MTAEEFDQSITMHPKMLEWFSKDKRYKDKIEEIKKFRLALGMIMGADIPGGSTQERGPFSWSVGPSGEKAWVDRFAVFYKNGTYDIGLPACSWFNQLPQGFSCGRGSVPVQDCDNGFERFVPVPCNEIVLKVANQDECPFDQVHYGPYGPYGGDVKQREYNLNEFDGEDCFVGVEWT